MYEDFKKIKENNPDVFKNANWQCVIKESKNFTVDLITYTDSNFVTLMHVGKNGYHNDEFYAENLDIYSLSNNEIDSLAEKMIW